MSKWAPPLFILLLILIAFHRLPFTFFQQDEWRAFGLMVLFKYNAIGGIKASLPQTAFEHFAPLSFLFEFLQLKMFGLNSSLFALFSLSLHLINSLLVYRLFNLLSRRNMPLSLAGALLFATNSLSHQAVSWLSSATSTQGAVLFALVSLILFFHYLEGHNPGALGLSVGSLFISLLFKENTAFLFLFLPVWSLLLIKSIRSAEFKRIILSLSALLLIYIFVRCSISLLNADLNAVGAINYGGPQASVATYVYRIITVPFKVIPQSLFSTGFLIMLSKGLTALAYPHYLVASDGEPNPFVVESIAFDFIGFLITIGVIVLSYVVFKHLRKLKDETSIFLMKFSWSFTVASYLPFVFIPKKGGFISIAEPRNLHIPLIGSSLFFALLVFATARWIINKKLLKSVYPVIICLSSLLIFLNIRIIRKDLMALEERSRVRKGILEKIIARYPILPDKVVFYTESDSAYYGLPEEEKIMPFQSGFGQTLLVWYAAHGRNLPSCLFKNDFLYPLEAQGYRECQGKGFGYYRKAEELKKTVKAHSIADESIIAFSYTDSEAVLSDISRQVLSDLNK